MFGKNRLLSNLLPQILPVTCGHSAGHSVTAQSIYGWAHAHVHVGARCSQTTAGKNLRSFPFFAALQFSASLFSEAHGCCDPARDHSVRFSRRCDATLTQLILKYLRKLGCVPLRQAGGVDRSADTDHVGLWLFHRLCRTCRSLSLPEHWPLPPFSSSPILPQQWRISSPNSRLLCKHSLSHSTTLGRTAILSPCLHVCFPDVSFHTLWIGPYTCLLEGCVCVCVGC